MKLLCVHCVCVRACIRVCTHVGVSGHVGAYVCACVCTCAGMCICASGVWVHACMSECDVFAYL